MNYDRVPNSLKWMLTTSFFHAGYEALLVNELRYLQLVERKFGLDIQVPSATSKLIHPPPLLSSFLPPFLPKKLICIIPVLQSSHHSVSTRKHFGGQILP